MLSWRHFVFDNGSENLKKKNIPILRSKQPVSDICKLFIHQSDQSGISGWKWSDVGVMRAGRLDEEGGRRWGRTHHATRQIGCDMDQHATLHPP